MGCILYKSINLNYRWLSLFQTLSTGLALCVQSSPPTIFKLLFFVLSSVIKLGASILTDLPAALDTVGQFWTKTPWAPCITEDSSMCTELQNKKIVVLNWTAQSKACISINLQFSCLHMFLIMHMITYSSLGTYVVGNRNHNPRCKIQIRIKIFSLHFTDILWIMAYRWQFLHFHTLSVGFQHPHLYWKLHSLCSAQQ